MDPAVFERVYESFCTRFSVRTQHVRLACKSSVVWLPQFRDRGGLTTPILGSRWFDYPNSGIHVKNHQNGVAKYSAVNYQWFFRIKIHARCAQNFMHEFYRPNDSEFSLRFFSVNFCMHARKLFDRHFTYVSPNFHYDFSV